MRCRTICACWLVRCLHIIGFTRNSRLFFWAEALLSDYSPHASAVLVINVLEYFGGVHTRRRCRQWVSRAIRDSTCARKHCERTVHGRHVPRPQNVWTGKFWTMCSLIYQFSDSTRKVHYRIDRCAWETLKNYNKRNLQWPFFHIVRSLMHLDAIYLIFQVPLIGYFCKNDFPDSIRLSIDARRRNSAWCTYF